MNLLTGKILLTDDIGVIHKILSCHNEGMKVLSLDEDGALDLNDPNTIGGTILLPPVECRIAEMDGDMATYDHIYRNYMASESVDKFMSAIIIYLFKGGNLMCYHPDIRSTAILKMADMIASIYGIRLGVCQHPEFPVRYSSKFIHIWLWILYNTGTIDPITYLKLMPLNVPLPDFAIEKLLMDIKPFGSTIQEQVETLYRLRVRYKEKPLIVPIFSYPAISETEQSIWDLNNSHR